MQINKELLIQFQKQLLSGNLRSVYLNALRKKSKQILLLESLNHFNPSVVNQFLHLLLTKESFDYQISQDKVYYHTLEQKKQKKIDQLSNQLDRLFYDQEEQFQEKGIESFAFGFPILCYKDPKSNKFIKAPLFLWALKIKKSKTKFQTWNIKKSDQTGVAVNPLLQSYLKSSLNIDIGNLEDYVESAYLSENNLVDACVQLYDQLNFNKVPFVKAYVQKGLIEEVNLALDINRLNDLKPYAPQLVWQGVFGIFKTSKSSIVADYEELILNDTPEDETSNSGQTIKRSLNNFSALPLNPSQENILNTIHKENDLLIQGPPGTGKSHTLTAIISNALINKETCLIISEKHTALQVIYDQLKELNLEHLAAFITNVHTDRFPVIDKIRKQIDTLENIEQFSPSKIHDIINLNKQIIQKHHEVLNTPIDPNDNKTWTEALGRYLQLEEKYPKAKLKSTLYKRDTTWKESLLIGSDLYQSDFKKSLLDAIKPNVLIEGSIKLQEEQLFAHTTKIQEACKQFRFDIERLENLYLQQQKLKININYDRLIKLIDDAVSEIEVLLLIRPDINRVHMQSWALKKFRSLTAKQRQVEGHIFNITVSVERISNCSKDYFDYHEISFDRYKENQVLAIKKELLKLKKELKHQLPNLVEQVNLDFSLKGAIQSLAKLHQNEFQEILNRFQNDVLNNEMLDCPKFTIDHTYELIDKINELDIHFKIIQSNIKDHFSDYYSWRIFYDQQSKLDKKLLSELTQFDSNKWLEIADKNYLYQLLLKNESPYLIKHNKPFQQVIESVSNEASFDQKELIYKWQKHQFETLYKFQNSHKYSLKALFNYRKSKNNSKYSLRTILNKEFVSYAAFCPITICSPTVCSDLFSGKTNVFDKLIIDEASQIKIEDIYPALLKAKKRIISGDKKQLAPSNYFESKTDYQEKIDEDETDLLVESESLIDFMEKKACYEKQLNFHYRSKHIDLINFSNHHFYNGRLIQINDINQNANAIHYYNINGTFDQHCNEEEIKKVISILKDVATHKSIGIACFNIHQRDAIWKAIYDECINDQEFQLKLDQLKANGLFVKNIESIQGEERDVMIISGTYGVNKEGKFKQFFGPLNHQTGYRLLNVLITRAKETIHYINSIPQEYIQSWNEVLTDNPLSGKGLFYSYIDYCEACFTNNSDQKNSILNFVNSNLSYKSEKDQTTTFNKTQNGLQLFVGKHLAEKLDDGIRMHYNYQIDGLTADLQFHYKGKSFIIDIDGIKTNQIEEAYNWDIYQEDILTKKGHQYIRTFSFNWWMDADKATTKLMKEIENFSKEEVLELV